MVDKQSETRERFLTGWRARMNHHEVEDKQREIREHHLGIGVALGSGLGVAIGAGLVLHAVLETYGWLPSFLAGLIVRRRALLLALVTVLLGSFLAAGFRGYFTPQLVIDDWDPGIVNLTQSVLAILGAAVSARAGQFLAARRSSNRPLQPTAREDARSG